MYIVIEDKSRLDVLRRRAARLGLRLSTSRWRYHTKDNYGGAMLFQRDWVRAGERYSLTLDEVAKHLGNLDGVVGKYVLNVPVELIDVDVPDEIGEEESRLKSEVVKWLDANAKGQWRFRNGIARRRETFRVAFENADDALLFKIRWM